MIDPSQSRYRAAPVVLISLCWILLATGAAASGILDYSAFKARSFIQQDANAPESVEADGFIFSAAFTLDDPNRTASGTLTLPNGDTHEFMRAPGTENLFHVETFDTEEDLHEAYPFGEYTFSLTVDGTTHTGSIQLTSTPFPNAPHVVNYDDLQEIDPAESFAVEWDPFEGGTEDDFISLQIEDSYESPDPWETGSLAGTATSAEVEAGTLDAGDVYDSSLNFFHIVDTASSQIDGAIGAGGVGTWTEFAVTTTGEPGAFAITTESLPNATLNEPYSAVLEASEPVAVWSLEDSDALPEGITLNQLTGELSGTPTEDGSFEITVIAVSSTFTQTDMQTLTLTVDSEDTSTAPPVIREPVFEEGAFSFVIASPDGKSVDIEVSPDLETWTHLTTADPESGVIEFRDPDAAEASIRFYRARWQ